MARGWESKSVESQQESLDLEGNGDRSNPSPEWQEQQRKLENLQLSRTRVLHDLQTACNPRYRLQLEAALAFLDAEIAKLP